jgi:hypothetical protein
VGERDDDVLVVVVDASDADVRVRECVCAGVCVNR